MKAGKVSPAKALIHKKLPDQKAVRRIYDEVEHHDERLELNLYIVGESGGRGGSMKIAYWPGCVSRGFTPELHGSMALVAERLGIELVELDRANCCGAGVIAEHSQELADTLNARTFAMAQSVDGALGMMNICSTCQGAQSECQERLDASSDYRSHVNEHLEPEGLSYERDGSWWNKNLLWILVEISGSTGCARWWSGAGRRADRAVLRLLHRAADERLGYEDHPERGSYLEAGDRRFGAVRSNTPVRRSAAASRSSR